MIDLHTHTTASDGLLSPTELVQEADRRGISVLGVTDHDTLDGLDEAWQAARSAGLTLVPGVELSTTLPGPEIHVLGYFVDPGDPVFRAGLRALADDRARRIERVVKQLRQAGFSLDLDAIMSEAAHGSIGRPHVARALIELGAAADMNDAFSRFLRRGTVGWAPRTPFSAEDAIALIRANGAIPVLAHPFSTGDPAAMAERLVHAGLQGFEVHYGEYDDAQRRNLATIAHEYALLPTGGSDYHGPRFREGRDLGTVTVPEPVWEQLRLAREERSA